MSTHKVVLLVEDDAAVNSLYRDYLSFGGCVALSTETADEALKLARECGPDLIVIDLVLPGVDGLTLAGRLRRDERTRGARLVAITAHHCQAVERRAREAGFDAYLVKPCGRDELVGTVWRLLERDDAILHR
jgi:DNA-binding response OmpR family regulator